MNWFIWALLSALFAGITAVLAKVGVTGLNSHLATAIRTSVVVVFTWSIALVSVGPRNWPAITSRQWLFLGLSGIATGLSWLCYFRALQLGEVSKVAPIDKLSVAIAIILSVFFLGERLGMRELAGAMLMIAGATVLAWK
jgi:bacterial/archaeal transporter family protein